ncbi:MAG TPA: ATP-binding protein, partial [Orrella sp.]
TSFIDVSQQRRAEAELRDVRHQIERTAYELTENLPVGTYTMVQPPDGGLAQFRFMSTRFLALTGLTREEAYGDPLKGFACVHPDDHDRWLELNAKAFSNRESFWGETRVVVNGQTRWITAESKPRPLDDGSTVWEGVLIDITERKLAEEALARAKARAEQLERLKSDFLTQMSHEIRTPLTSILGLADLMVDEPLADPQREKVQQIRSAGRLLLGIVNDILDLSKIEAGQLITEEQPFNLQDILSQIDSWQEAWAKPGVALCVEAPTEPVPTLIGDRRRIEQVLGNLVGNAMKFTEAGEVKVSADVSNRGDNTLVLRLAVTDTGCGIAADLLPQLFNPFVQADSGTARRHGGTGLGLSISKQLVELMGGRLGANSQLGQGSTFWFELPLAFDHHQQVGNTLAAPVSRGERLAGLKILVVDDSASIRDLIQEFLVRESAIVELASNGAQALTILRQHGASFDCVLMDVQMPIMDGLTATQNIRALRELDKLPVLAMTAGLLAEQQTRARQAGMADLVAKPVDLDRMVTQIQQVTGRGTEPSKQDSETTNPMPTIAGIDREHLNHTMEGNRGLFERLIVVFIDEFDGLDERISQVLSAGLNAETINEAGRLAHSLRGAASQIGAVELVKAAAALEHALHHDGKHSPAKLAAMGKLLSDLIKSLKKHLNQG